MALGDARPVPERLRNAERVDADSLPPALFVADAMHLAVVHMAERDGELIARFASERARRALLGRGRGPISLTARNWFIGQDAPVPLTGTLRASAN